MFSLIERKAYDHVLRVLVEWALRREVVPEEMVKVVLGMWKK